jgi:hypothetical protein
MAELAYKRLQDDAVEHLRVYRTGMVTLELRDALFLDAWSIVDAAKRLRTMVKMTPGLKQKIPAIKLFLGA